MSRLEELKAKEELLFPEEVEELERLEKGEVEPKKNVKVVKGFYKLNELGRRHQYGDNIHVVGTKIYF